ncbi:MAG: hypothetical protein HY286_05335 [Planctomycetes bacterium]|nr:hypothetical protein [Planctomycetota bacterium]
MRVKFIILMMLATAAPANAQTSRPAFFNYSSERGIVCESDWHVDAPWTDHLGTTLIDSIDIDKDGVPDVIVTALNGSVVSYDCPSYVAVFSGATHRKIWQSDGDDNFGISIAALGDVDRDGIIDFAAGAPRYKDWNGRIIIISGKDGRRIKEIEGCPGAMLGTYSCGLDDLDGDGCNDFAAGGMDDSVVLYSSRILKTIRTLPIGGCPTSINDMDGDGHADVCVLSSTGDSGKVCVFSSMTGKLLPGMYSTDVKSGEKSEKWFGCIAAAVKISDKTELSFIVGDLRGQLHFFGGKDATWKKSICYCSDFKQFGRVLFCKLEDCDGDGVDDLAISYQTAGDGSFITILSGANGDELGKITLEPGVRVRSLARHLGKSSAFPQQIAVGLGPLPASSAGRVAIISIGPKGQKK